MRPAPLPPPPEARAAEIKYSIVVSNQPVRDVLLAIARETQVNVDIHPGVEGAVTINAIDQTLKQILTRLAKQIDMRYEIDEQTIHVMPDSPYLRNYRVDYVNMARDTTETVAISTQVISGAIGTGAAGRLDGRQQLHAADQQHLAPPLLGNAREEHQGHAARDGQAPARGQQRDVRERPRPDGRGDHADEPATAGGHRHRRDGNGGGRHRRHGDHPGADAGAAGLGVRRAAAHLPRGGRRSS